MRVGAILISSASCTGANSGCCSSAAPCSGADSLLACTDVGGVGASLSMLDADAVACCGCKGCPQLLQNFASSRFAVLHDGQSILPSFELTYNCFCKRLASSLLGYR